MLFSSFSTLIGPPLIYPTAILCRQSIKICSALSTGTHNDNNKTTTTSFLDNRSFSPRSRTSKKK